MKNLTKRLPPLPDGKKRRRYTDQQKIEVLTLLRENSYNYRKTEFDTGIPYSTIKVWYNQHKNELNEMTSVSCIAEKVEQNIGRLKTDFISAHFKAMSGLAAKAIERAEELIEKERDLSKINGTIKVVTDFFAKIGEVDPESANKGDTYISVIRQTINNMNAGKE